MAQISIFTTVTDPERRGDHYQESIECYKALADEVVIINGGQPLDISGVKIINYKWPNEFNWKFIGEQFQRGYEACGSDWVIHMDLDFIFHEQDFWAIKKVMDNNRYNPAVYFRKQQFLIPDRYYAKSHILLAVNKKLCGDNIKFDSGGDLCQPSFNGSLISEKLELDSKINVYNYEKITKTEAQIENDIYRMERAYHRHFNQPLYAKNGMTPLEGWYKMMEGRMKKPLKYFKLNDHPIFMQKIIAGLKPDQFGYDGFGRFERLSYV